MDHLQRNRTARAWIRSTTDNMVSIVRASRRPGAAPSAGPMARTTWSGILAICRGCVKRKIRADGAPLPFGHGVMGTIPQVGRIRRMRATPSQASSGPRRRNHNRACYPL